MGYQSKTQQSLMLGKLGMELMSQGHLLEEELGEIKLRYSTTYTMDTDEAQEINKQIIEKIEKEPEGAEYLNIVS